MSKNCGSITPLWPRAATDADHGEREASAEDTSSVHAIEAYWAKPLRKGDLLIATALVHSHVARARPSCSCKAAPHANRLPHTKQGETWVNKALEAS